MISVFASEFEIVLLKNESSKDYMVIEALM